MGLGDYPEVSGALEDEKRTEIEKAQYVEKQAAASYSVCLSDGDDAEEQRAEKAL